METTRKLRISLEDLRVESFETVPEAEMVAGTVVALSDGCTDCSNCSGCSGCSACSNCTGCSNCSQCSNCTGGTSSFCGNIDVWGCYWTRHLS
ncbi:MAG: hypothetical protein JO040_10490 [Gemmatimonadetes bacterium]|nr:hypothetical protein [Gemmatimonadota bacterium]